MIRLTLSQRLTAVFFALLLACGAALMWIQMRSTTLHEQETVQRLSRGLAEHIARSGELMDARGMRGGDVRALFGKLMAVNPSVEVYLLDDQGRILGHDAPEGHLKRDRVDLAPVQALLRDEPLPILGDDPRSVNGRKVFNAAPLWVQGRQGGYIYVVLVGEQREALAANVAGTGVLRTTLWSLAIVVGLGLLAGAFAFGWVTRPLRRLTARIQGFDVDQASPAVAPPPPLRPGERDELAILDHSFGLMSQRLGEQWQQLREQDLQRRELVANISHDLRTPLSSLHGYLETLSLKDATLTAEERQRYLGIALAQSQKVGRLAQALFELARLEHGGVVLDMQAFSLPDLLQDVFQKFELAAEARRQTLSADIPPRLPSVRADLGLIERVLTNLLDNAIRHTPEGGRITVSLRAETDKVWVRVADSGPGIAPERRANLFHTPPALGSQRPDSGGLGLLIVHRIVQLHGGQIRLLESEAGAVFEFALPV
ncbi:HAMP domain-containing sensor histidine kinase [Stenotrophomonas sp. 278]|uniref:sensor histidine kinase n=1 Tax=Stenotrophomonas sp. 278 TaxID=2479851 RepID=UPI000F661BEC|nr:HAMP domain-containing sensor histidine kinase [Stenotrophomonas sp. 278]RRU11073.1 sensor histidine kinase [Stenotrophomonas sp. 278]